MRSATCSSLSMQFCEVSSLLVAALDPSFEQVWRRRQPTNGPCSESPRSVTTLSFHTNAWKTLCRQRMRDPRSHRDRWLRRSEQKWRRRLLLSHSCLTLEPITRFRLLSSFAAVLVRLVVSENDGRRHNS